MQTRERRRHTRRKGGVAIVFGGAIAVAGGVALAVGLHNGAGPVAATPSWSGPTTHGSSTVTGDSPFSSRSARRTTRPATGHASQLPMPRSNSTRVPIANPAGAACVPTRLTVSGVGITGEPVAAMGTNAQGQIYPPPHTTMWYDRSAQPGQRGISVIAGHVTYDGPDNFYNLRNVRVGTAVTVLCANDKAVNLTVTHVESVPKNELTTDQRVWGGSSTPVVVLVTCDINSPMVGGHHLNNFVVWTKPASPRRQDN